MGQIQKAVLTIFASHDDYLVKAATSQNFTLAQPTPPFSSTPIGCHAPFDTFFCMLIGPQAPQFIIYSPQSFDIQYFCINYSHMLLNEENNLVY